MICKHEEFTRKNTTSDGAILYQELPNTYQNQEPLDILNKSANKEEKRCNEGESKRSFSESEVKCSALVFITNCRTADLSL